MKKPNPLKFTGRAILIIIPVIALYMAFFYAEYKPVLSNSLSFDAKTYELNRIKLKQADIMVMGSSVALNGINTRVMKANFHRSYYNFSSWNLQVADDYYLLKYYVLKYKPKYVIFPSTMHDFTLPPDTDLPADLNIGGSFLPWYYIKNFANIHEIIKRKNLFDLSVKDNNRYDCLIFDDGGGVELQITKENISAKRLREDIGVFPTEHSSAAYKSLADLAAFLKLQGVKLIFIQTPYSNTYVPAQKLPQVNAHFNKCKTIVENAGGVYLNYSQLLPQLNSGAYVDAAHLSAQGSIAFTQQVVNDLKTVIK